MVNGSVVFIQTMDTVGNENYFKIGNYLKSVKKCQLY